jgi:hypothetical protein
MGWRGPSIAQAEERLRDASLRLLARRQFAHVELYHRLSHTIRIVHALDDGTEDISRRSGIDEGTALRLWSESEGVRFAAVSGSVRGAIEDAAKRAQRGPVSDSPDDLCAGPERAGDHDDVPIPDERTLATWLATARDRVGRAVERMWVEAAETLETWIVDGEVRASRSRARGWAGLELGATERGSGGPLILASRAWNRLDSADWGRLLEWRLAPDSELQEADRRAETQLVLFSPECSATLVSTLVRASAPIDSEIAVGPGFCVMDAPDEPLALFGGVFDDLGFATSRQVVADGRAFCAQPVRGTYRRPSFRDTPVALPAHLVVAPPDTAPPEARWSIHRLSIHALAADRWVLDVDATLWAGGEARCSLSGAHVTTGPRELLAGCIGGVGLPVPSHRGVRTPALLFEGLAVKP